MGKGVLAPIPVGKYKLWDETVPLFTKGEYPDGKMASTQGLSPIEAMFYADKDGKKLADKPTELLTIIPTIYNADTLGIRPDLVGGATGHELEGPARSRIQGQDRAGRLRRRSASWTSPWRSKSRGDIKYGDKGNMTKDEIDKTIEIMIEIKKAGHFRVVLEHLRPVGEPDGLGRGGDPVDVVAGRHRGALARHRLLLRAAQGRLSRLGQSAWRRWRISAG